jgi:hypothetical protein
MKKTFLKFELNFFVFENFGHTTRGKWENLNKKFYFENLKFEMKKKMKFSFLKFEMKISV